MLHKCIKQYKNSALIIVCCCASCLMFNNIRFLHFNPDIHFIPYLNILYYIILYHTIPYHAKLYYTILYYIILSSLLSSDKEKVMRRNKGTSLVKSPLSCHNMMWSVDCFLSMSRSNWLSCILLINHVQYIRVTGNDRMFYDSMMFRVYDSLQAGLWFSNTLLCEWGSVL